VVWMDSGFSSEPSLYVWEYVFKSGYERFETRVSLDKERIQIREDENIERNHEGMNEEVQD